MSVFKKLYSSIFRISSYCSLVISPFANLIFRILRGSSIFCDDTLGMVSSSTNKEPTPLYQFNRYGFILAWALEYLYKPDKREEAKREVCSHITGLYTVESYLDRFSFELYGQLMDYDKEISNDRKISNKIKDKPKGFFDQVIINLLGLLYDHEIEIGNITECLDAALQSIETYDPSFPSAASKYAEIYLRILNRYKEVSEEQRPLNRFHIEKQQTIKLQLKHTIENQIMPNTPKDWVKTWRDNLHNHNVIVLIAKCRNEDCGEEMPLTVSHFTYMQEKSKPKPKPKPKPGLTKSKLESDYYLYRKDCTECHKKDSVYVYDRLEGRGVLSSDFRFDPEHYDLTEVWERIEKKRREKVRNEIRREENNERISN